MKASNPGTASSDALAGGVLARITSPMPTRYKLLAGGQEPEIHVYCALDTFEYALLAPDHYEVIAEPPVGSPLHFRLSQRGPEPRPVWMSTIRSEHIAQLPAVTGPPSRCCPYIHFFNSEADYLAWKATLPGNIATYIECLPLHEAWARTRAVFTAHGAPGFWKFLGQTPI